jgi:RNA-directed DNA polymerase
MLWLHPANLYLHLLDRVWARHQLATRYEARIVRYADDLVICCRRGTEKPMAILAGVLGRLDLSLNETKTRIVDAQNEPFAFLGFSIGLRRSRRSGKRYPHVEPAKRSIKRIKDRVTQLTDRRRTPIPLEWMTDELNRTLRGWSNYFHYRNSSGTFKSVKVHVEERMRTQLRRRYQLHSRAQAYQAFPGRFIYDRLGLFKLPTTASWRSAHASV